MFVLRLLSVVVKFALVAAVIAGGVYVYENRESIGKAISGSGPAPVDFNCSLPGNGYPWLRQDLSYTVQFTSSAVFVSTVPDVSPWAAFLPIPIAGDGTALSMDDVYGRLCLVHPQLGGSGLTKLSVEEAKQLVCGGQDQCLQRECDDFPDLYSDELPLEVDEARMCLEPVRMYWLPPIPKDLRDALATVVASRQTPIPTPAPTPAPSGETRRYRITVNGSENALPWPVPDGPVRSGVRFDYRLIGEFTLERPTPSKPWTVASRRVVTADLKYSSLYPADRCQVALKCENRFCRQLHEASTLRLRVTVDGDEIVVSWGAFAPSVLVTGTCTDPSVVTGVSYASDRFQERIGGERMPLQDQYIGPHRIQRYEGRSDIKTSFDYGLERLP